MDRDTWTYTQTKQLPLFLFDTIQCHWVEVYFWVKIWTLLVVKIGNIYRRWFQIKWETTSLKCHHQILISSALIPAEMQITLSEATIMLVLNSCIYTRVWVNGWMRKYICFRDRDLKKIWGERRNRRFPFIHNQQFPDFGAWYETARKKWLRCAGTAIVFTMILCTQKAFGFIWQWCPIFCSLRCKFNKFSSIVSRL